MAENQNFEGFWEKKSDSTPKNNIILASETKFFTQRANQIKTPSWLILFEGDKKYTHHSFEETETSNFCKNIELENKNSAILIKNKSYVSILVNIVQKPQSLKQFNKEIFWKIREQEINLNIKHFKMISLRLSKDKENRLSNFFVNMMETNPLGCIEFDGNSVIKLGYMIAQYNQNQKASEYCKETEEILESRKWCENVDEKEEMEIQERFKKDFNEIEHDLFQYSQIIRKHDVLVNVSSLKQTISNKYTFGACFINQNKTIFENMKKASYKKHDCSFNRELLLKTERPTMVKDNLFQNFQYESKIIIDKTKAFFYSSPFLNFVEINHIFIDASWIEKNMIISVVGINKNERTYQTMLFVLIQPHEIENELKKTSTNSQIYSAIIKHLKGFHQIKSITCDFETSLLKAVNENNLKVWGCYFHYLQNLRVHTFQKSASFQAFQILKIIPLFYLKNQNISLIEKAKQIIKNGRSEDILLLQYAEKTYFEQKQNTFNIKIDSNDDYFKLTNNACERLFNVLKIKWRMIKKTTGLTTFQKIRHILIENLSINNQTKLGGKKNKKGAIHYEIENLQKSLETRIKKYEEAIKTNVFTNLQKKKIEKKKDSDSEHDFDKNDSDQEDFTNIDGRRIVVRETTKKLLNDAKFANPKKANTVSELKSHLNDTKIKPICAIVTQKQIMLQTIEAFKQESNESSKNHTIQVNEEENLKKRSSIHEFEEEPYSYEERITDNNQTIKVRSQQIQRSKIEGKEFLSNRIKKIKHSEESEMYLMKIRLLELKAENAEKAKLMAEEKAKIAEEQAKADREAKLKTEEQVIAEKEARAIAEKQVLIVNEQFTKKIEELEEKLRKTQAISNEGLVTGKSELKTGDQILFQKNDSEHAIKSDLLKANQNNLIVIETKNTFEKSGKNVENGEKSHFFENEVLGLEETDSFRDNQIFLQSNNKNQLYNKTIQEGKFKNSWNSESENILKNEENCNQNANMGSVFGIFFGPGESPKEKQEPNKKENNKSQTTTSNKRPPGNKKQQQIKRTEEARRKRKNPNHKST